jgi:hypothetical protein
MKTMDEEHLSCWIHCMSASRDLERALGPPALDQLSKQLDLSPAIGGADLLSLERSADREFPRSFASISSALIFFCRKTNLQFNLRIADALEEMHSPCHLEPLSATVRKVKEVSNITLALLKDNFGEEIETTIHLVKDHRVVEVPSKEDLDTTLALPEPLMPLDPRRLSKC